MSAVAKLAANGASRTNAQTMQLVAKEAGLGSVKKFFEDNQAAMKAVLPKHVNADRMLKIVLGAIRQTPKLQDCTIESLFGAAVLCSQFGLEPNTPLGECYLIPFYNSRQEKTEVQFIAGYKGLISLARRSGQIISISARTVYENDTFDIQYGTIDEIKHVPTMGERGGIIGYYAVAKLKDGGVQFEFMSNREVGEIRDASQGAYKDEWVNKKKTGKKVKQESSPWWKHEEQMGKKTVIRRLCNYLPMSMEMASAIQVDSVGEVGSQGLDAVLNGEYSVVSEDGEGEGDDGEFVDTETGVITQQEESKVYSYAEVREALTIAKTPAEVTEASKMINGIQDQAMRDELDDFAANRLAELA